MAESSSSKKAASPSKPRQAARAPKTVATATPVEAFLAGVDEKAREDCRKLDVWMRAATGDAGVMYGKSIVGYGSSTIVYADGRQAPWMKMGFSPRAKALTLYGLLTPGPSAELLAKLGKHSTGKGCLYIKRLSEVSEETLQALIKAAAK